MIIPYGTFYLDLIGTIYFDTFNIMKINNNEKNIVCGKPYFLQGIRMKKIIKKIKSLTNYSLKFIG